MKKYKIGFIGTGGRSVAYAMHYANCEEVEVVALADPNASHRKVMAKKSGLNNNPAEYNDFRDMLKELDGTLDGVVIASPNHLHAEHAIPCFEMGLPVALEKPLDVSMAASEAIVDAERINNGRSILGFVLRSSPFYSKIHELVSSGAIGNICSIQADELPGFMVSSIMRRGSWRRTVSTSGGAMLEKSSHDMDLLNWMVQSRPLSLNSYGGKRIFNPNGMFSDNCEECSFGLKCKYFKPQRVGHEDKGEETLFEFVRDSSLCVFNNANDVADTQSVVIEYESGAIVNFMLNFNCSGEKASRNFHAIGTRGRIWGNLHEAKVFHFDNFNEKLNTYDCSGDGSGHGGGDRIHALELLKMMKDASYKPEQNATAGYLSAAMCFAADISMRERKRINFRYGFNRITFN